MKVWNFASGYVKIGIMGDYPERIVNRALDAGMPVYDASFEDSGRLVCCVPMRSFKTLRRCARGSGCKVAVLSKRGLPYLYLRLRREYILAAFALAAAAVLVLALSRLWRIDIDYGGADKASVDAALAGMGLRVGMALKDIEPKIINSELGSLKGVVNAKAVRHGVVLCIGISAEGQLTAGNAEAASNVSPSSIYADRDCVIASISVTSGAAAVTEGEAVKSGQLLISGDLGSLKEGYSVSAEGEVYGRLLYRATGTAERMRTEYRRDGRTAEVIAIVLFGKELLFNLPYEAYELEPLDEGSVDACPVPVKVRRYRCFGLSPTPCDIGDDAARLLAASDAQSKLYASIPKDARIVSVNTEIISDDGSASATVTAVTIERIGFRREL